MTGWFADFFRFAWGLIYWNARKEWFRRNPGQRACPCQSPSDSGRARETHCDAVLSWHRPARFRRLCPLLAATPDGWRCSVDTPQVRPFWARAVAYVGGTLAGLYLAGALGVFIFLRVVGYPVNIFQVVWPPSWHQVGEARGWYFTEKARQAFAANRTGEALLYLSNAYEFDPSNYAAGLLLAKSLQSGQATVSNRVFERLYQEHPARREETAEDWLRALLARGDFVAIQELARLRLVGRTPHASAWMRALIFATRQSGDSRSLQALAAAGAAPDFAWAPLIQAELSFRAGRSADGRAQFDRREWSAQPPYAIYYQIEKLLALGDPTAALDRLAASVALDDETRVALRLDALARRDARAELQRQVDAVLMPPLSAPAVKIMAVQLIRQPDPALFNQLYERWQREPLPFTTDTAGVHFSLLCAAGAQRDWAKFTALVQQISARTPLPPGLALSVENFFRGRTTSDRAASILPLLPLPMEVTYALLERYPGTARPGAVTLPAARP